jgi:septum formation protein
VNDVLVLASASPRRLALLRAAGLSPTVDPSGADESVLPGEDPRGYARRVASAKLAAVCARHPGGTVLAADTVVDVDGDVLGQPRGRADALTMLARLSGRTHLVHTAVEVRAGGDLRGTLVTSEVTFRRLDPVRMDWYVGTGEPVGKAGGYAVQGLGSALVAGVRGSFTNVIGLPVPEALALLTAP